MIKLLLLCGDTNRAKSYASILKKHLKCNITGLLYGIEKEKITKNIFKKLIKIHKSILILRDQKPQN